MVDDDTRGTNSWGTFCAAVAMGNADIAENKDKFNQDDVNYQLVSIAAARRLGILPIAFDSTNPFQANDPAAGASELTRSTQSGMTTSNPGHHAGRRIC